MALQNNADEFVSMIELNKGIIYKVANAYCKNDENRKDLVQEIVFQLWRSFESYDNQYKLSTWMYRISLNVAISFYRKESRRTAYILDLSESIIKTAAVDESTEANKNIHLLQQFINELNELDRAVIILYLEEKSHREIAEILGISESNSSTKIARIKDKLKQKFTDINQ